MAKKAIFDKKNILVVGGAGFIGSHLCEELVSNNKVICLDNFITGEEENISHLLQNPDFKLIRHDIVSPIVLEDQRELDEFRFDFQGLQEIYFLASPASPKAYLEHPIETLLANSVGLRNALDMAVKYKAKLLFASSDAVYGQITTEPVKEDFVGIIDQFDARSCYSEAKKFGETLVDRYREEHDLDTKIVRISNCYGPRMKLTDGRMIPEMISLAISGGDLVIHGDEKSVGSYFFVSDLVKAMMKIMETKENGPINIASEWQNKFSEIAEEIIKLVKSKSKIKYKAKDKTMADQPKLDISLAKEKLGWFPIILMNEGLKETVDYLTAQKGIREPGA
ncbi:MAG: GDP-mannose 4,6-dehydratase [Patescibacteria group bacterium]